MTEAEFIDSIDCRFPYTNGAMSRRLISEACAIGPNAAFAIADELARPGQGTDAPVAARLESLRFLRATLEHPLTGAILDLTERMIRNDNVSVGEAIAVMKQVATYPGQFAALSVAYMSCDDREGLADQIYRGIVERWQAV